MSNKQYDVVVIGGGPAGMISAGRAGTRGLGVVLLEKKAFLGLKLMITGKGRCNLTNAEEDFKKFIGAYGPSGKFLYSALHKFSNQDVVDFFNNYGLSTKVERGNRIFPVSDQAGSVVDCLEKYLQDNKVEVKLQSPIEKINFKNKKITGVVLNNGEEIIAHNFIIATGGKSYPGTGSTGDAYAWLAKMGHTIVKPKPALTPVIVKENFLKRLEGLSLKNVSVSLWGKKKIASVFGEALFTNNGLSGPIILNLSKKITENKEKDYKLKINFKPALDSQTLDKRIQKDFAEQRNKQFKNGLDGLLPKKLIPVIIDLSGIDGNKKINEVTKIERKKLLNLLQDFELTVVDLVGFEKAIITAGGVSLKEIDPQTMKSKIMDNLYLAGEVLDIDGPTGGYNLQVAWSTGYTAGDSVAS